MAVGVGEWMGTGLGGLVGALRVREVREKTHKGAYINII